MIKKIQELEIGEFFVFIIDQTMPYFKVGNGYISVTSEGIYTRGLEKEVAVITREIVNQLCYKYDIGPDEVTRIVKEGLEEFPNPNYWERNIYIFRCTECGNDGRKTYKVETAAANICRKCKIAQKSAVNENQLSLIPE